MYILIIQNPSGFGYNFDPKSICKGTLKKVKNILEPGVWVFLMLVDKVRMEVVLKIINLLEIIALWKFRFAFIGLQMELELAILPKNGKL